MNAVIDARPLSPAAPPLAPVSPLGLTRCARVLEAVGAPALAHAGQQVLLANAAMQRLLGYTLAELQAMPFEAWAEPEHRAAVRAYGLRALEAAEELPVLEVRALSGSGASRMLELTARRLQDDDGPLVVMTAQDLSDIHFVQQSLLDMSQLMHQIVENDPVPTFVIDAQHRVSHWNAACARLTGIPAYQVLGSQDAWRAFYPDARPLLADLVMNDGVESDGPALYGAMLSPSNLAARAWQLEAFFPGLGSNGRWLHVTAAPLLNTEGQVIGAIETLQDVSDRRAAEDELRRHRNELEEMVASRTAELLISNHDLDAFLENAPVGIVASAGPRVVRHNKTFCRMFGVPNCEAVGLLSRELFFSDDDYKSFIKLAVARLGAGESFSHETRVRTFSGEALWVQMIAYVADSAIGEPRVWWLLQDRTEVMRAQRELVENYRALKDTNDRLAEAQSQLLQSEKMASIGQLAAGVAHEINNPIGFVNSNLGSLRRYVEGLLALLQAYEGGQPREALGPLRDAADIEFIAEDLPILLKESEDGLNRVKKIVQDLKDFSRVDHADWQDADLNAGLESTLNVVMNEVKYKATVVREYGSLPPVRCLAGQLNQVFMNLIVNAAHAIEGHGTLWLRTGTSERDGASWAWVEVQDTGCGMPPEVQKRIFEPFFTTKPVGQGTGLGLSLSFSIMQKHGGQIELQSQPGEGTRFRVWMPVAGPTS